MHLAQRAYIFLVLTAVLAIAGVWSAEYAIHGLWRWPALILSIGIALESYFVRNTLIRAAVEMEPRAFLGRALQAAFAFHNDSNRDVRIEYAPVTPPGIDPLGAARKITARPCSVTRDVFTVMPAKLGVQQWPAIPARIRGRFGLVWWSRELPAHRTLIIAPDTLHAQRGRPTGAQAGVRPRKMVGAGSELHQLRAYARGDPLARIDWKATARRGTLISREFSEDQHLDILIAIDAGRSSRIRAGALDRLGLFANIAARFAEAATPNDDRVGLLVFSDRPLIVRAPDRGLAAVARMRRSLERLSVQAAESDPLAAAISIRTLLRHRSLVVLLTDPEDATVADQLARAVRLLSPPHLVVVAGVHSPEIAALAQMEAVDWRDPWIALAAHEREASANKHRELLRRLGAPVVAAREELLERAVFEEYETLRRSRRIG
jgi:uncharacterized protein (DUF58 family)